MEIQEELFLKAIDLAFEKQKTKTKLDQIAVFILRGQINPKPKK